MAVGSIAIPYCQDAIWQVLTDYEHLSQFIEEMDSSGVLADSGNAKIIYQAGTGSFLFFRRHLYVKLMVQEFFPDSISFYQLHGPFKDYYGYWHLTKDETTGVTTTQCIVVAKPDFFVPGFIYRLVISKNYRKILTDVLTEVERRVKHP